MSKTRSTIVLSAGLLLTLGAGHAALAADPAPTGTAPAMDAKAATEMFNMMDTNKDGVLTKEEFAAHHMADDFAKADKNGDGKVTREEYGAMPADHMGNMPGM